MSHGSAERSHYMQVAEKGAKEVTDVIATVVELPVNVLLNLILSFVHVM